MGELLRYAIYEPLGGRSNTLVSVPMLFAVNCIFHYGLSYKATGDMAIGPWNRGFLILGSAVTAQMLLENHLFGDKGKEKEIVDSDDSGLVKRDSIISMDVMWQMFCFGLLHASMSATVHVLNGRAVRFDLTNLCDGFVTESIVSDSIVKI